MTQKLTEEQQRAAHKVIVANRGDCAKESNFLSCIDCPNNSCNSGVLCFGSKINPTAFQAKNLRRSQAWLDQHITDAEIMAESPKEFCERLVRTGKCKPLGDSCAECAKDYWATHKITPQEPPKRRPTPDEMVVGATVRVRLWDELVKDGVLDSDGFIIFESLPIIFNKSMRKFCGTTHKIIRSGVYANLDFCDGWTFIPEMLDYVEPEKVAEPKATKSVNFFDWFGKKVVFKDGRNNGASYTVCGVKQNLDLQDPFTFEFKSNYSFGLLEIKGHSFPAQLFNLCETQDAASPEPVANTPAPDTLRIIALEGQVDDLTKKLAASKKLCDRLHRRLRANWEAKRDGEVATREEIIAWFDAGKGTAIINGYASRIRLMNCTDWIPATRWNLKL